MGMVIGRNTAAVNAGLALFQGFELFLTAAHGIVNF
jgi:hypothetical protein